MTGAVIDSEIRQQFIDHPDAAINPRGVLAGLVLGALPLVDEATLDAIVERLFAVVAGLGPIDELLRDPEITDILINGPGPVWIERNGVMARSGVSITNDEIAVVLERAFDRNGLSVDRAHPIGDTRLVDGARISAVLSPLAIEGTHIAIRKFSTNPLPLEAFGPPAAVERLRYHLSSRANIVVFGATGTGKTSLVNAMAAEIDPGERVVTIEDAAELRIPLPHVVRLECRPENGEGAGRIDTRALVRAALRLRPDRLIVGEVRGPEALELVWAMSSGHTGSLSTCHAKSAIDALYRLETFVMLADAALPLTAVRAQVRSAVDVLVGLQRTGGARRVTSIDEVAAL